MPEMEAAEREATAALATELAAIPNLPADDTPDGKDETDNVEVRRWGAPPSFPEDMQAEGAFRDRRGFGPDGFRGCGETVGRALCRA